MAKANYSGLSAKKMFRTILRSPVQFLAMVLILALGATLFTGLYGSHLSFKDQVERMYTRSNAADIWIQTYYEEDEVGVDATKKDFQLIESTIGTAGTTETQYLGNAKINGLEALIQLSDNYPTVNKPWLVRYTPSTEQPNDYFFMYNESLANNVTEYGDTKFWRKPGNVPEIANPDEWLCELPFSVSAPSLFNYIKDNEDKSKRTEIRLVNVLQEHLKENGTNILNNEYITLKAKPTNTIGHDESILPNRNYPYSYFMSRKFLEECLNKSILENYDVQGIYKALQAETDNEKKETLKKAYDLLSNPKETIMEKYWFNNRFFTKLNDSSQADKYRSEIETAFKNKQKNNLVYLNTLQSTVTYKQVQSDVLQSEQLCYVFPPIFFLVAVLIELTTMSQMILKERNEIGTLRALGVSKGRLYAYYMALIGFVSLLGVVIGVIAGPLALPIVLNMKFDLLYTLPALHIIYPTYVVIALIVGVVLITCLIAFLISRKEVQQSPVLCMRPRPVNLFSRKKLKDINNKKISTRKLCLNMARRNIICAPSRSIMVIIAVLGCTALLCCGFSIDDSINKGLTNDMTMFFNTDGMIYFSNPDENTVKELNEMQSYHIKLDEKGEKYYEPAKLECWEAYGYLPTSTNKPGDINTVYDTYVYSVDTIHEGKNNFFDFKQLPSGNTVTISNKLANTLNAKVGDSLDFTILGKRYNGQIGSIVNTFIIHGIFIDGTFGGFPLVERNATNAYIRVNEEYLKYTKENTSAPKTKQDIIDEVKAINGIKSITDKTTLTTTIVDIVDTISYITVIIKVFAIILAIVALYNLGLLNFKENIRNIATMKVLGFNRKEIAETLFFEIMILSVAGATIGLFLGFPLAVLTLATNQVPIVEFFYTITALSVFLSLIISLGTAAVVNIFLGLKNKKVKMVESLKSIE